MTSPASPINTILVGDCIKSMAALPAASIDLIFADPPYNIGYKYDKYEDSREDADYIKWTCKWISACTRLLKPTGSLFVLIGDEYAAETRMHLKKLQAEHKLAFRNWIIWHYTFGQNCKVKFNRSHAHLFYAVGPALITEKLNLKENKIPFTFNRQDIAVPSARQTTYGDSRANPGGKLPDDTWYLRPQETDGYFKPDEDTWYLSRLCGTFKERTGWHPCQLPESLLERIIKVASNPDDVVFDPFTGSGTTLATAARLGRRWLGCELSEEYAAKATERIHRSATGEKRVVTYADKGIVIGQPKKKAERKKSPKNGKTIAKKVAKKTVKAVAKKAPSLSNE